MHKEGLESQLAMTTSLAAAMIILSAGDQIYLRPQAVPLHWDHNPCQHLLRWTNVLVKDYLVEVTNYQNSSKAIGNHYHHRRR